MHEGCVLMGSPSGASAIRALPTYQPRIYPARVCSTHMIAFVVYFAGRVLAYVHSNVHRVGRKGRRWATRG
jgi:hypothetical protein